MSDDKNLEHLEQVAMLMLCLPEEQSSKIFQHLDPKHIQGLIAAMASLKSVSNDDAAGVLNQFFHLYKQHAGIKKAKKDSLSRTLKRALGETAAKNLVSQLYGDDADALMHRLEWVDVGLLAEEISQEHSQLQANLLAMLSPKKSAELLALLPRYSHDELLYRIATLEEINDEAVQDLERMIERCLLRSQQRKSSRVEGVKRVSEIVNNYDGPKERLLTSLRYQDASVADKVESNMYDFIILSRQSDDTLQALVSEVDPELMASALKGTDQEVRKAIFGALPKRMGDSLHAQMEMLGGIPASRAEQARAAVMDKAKSLAQQDKLDLQLFEDPVVD